MANKLKFLHSLFLQDILIEDEACRYIGKITSLVDLNMARTGMGASNSEHFGGLINLKYFDVAGTSLSLRHIARLFLNHRKLQQLNFMDTKVEMTHEEVTELTNQWPSLVRIVYNNQDFVFKSGGFVESFHCEYEPGDEHVLTRVDGQIRHVIEWELNPVVECDFEISTEGLVYEIEEEENEL